MNPTDPTDPSDPTDPTDPTNPTGPTLRTSPPILDPVTGGGQPLGGFGAGEPIFWVSAPAKDFPGVLPASSPSPVPLPPSAWLMGTALFGLISIARRRRQQVIVVDALPSEA